MKKIILMCTLVLLFSCSDDERFCDDCDKVLGTDLVTMRFCNNDDDTMTFTNINGEEEIIDLNGESFLTVVDMLKSQYQCIESDDF